MALEAFMFSEDPLTNYTTCSKEYNNLYGGTFTMDYYDVGNYSSLYDGDILDIINSNNLASNQEPLVENTNQWEALQQHQFHTPITPQQYGNNVLLCDYYSSPEEAPPTGVVAPSVAESGTRRKRRRRSGKNKEEVEQQRMTHIAVERNRRKQMNEYLASIRSLMPPSYVLRGDQASIVAGAINYVKELEQLLQSMEAQKINQSQHQQECQVNMSPPGSGGDTIDHIKTVAGSSDLPPPTGPQPLFAEFFSFPQYSAGSSSQCQQQQQQQQQSVGCNSVSSNSGVGEIEVTMVESHANVKILAKKQPKQLLKLIAGFQGLRLNVLHLNVTTTLDSFVLYSLSLKVEEGCQLNSVDDIAAAANHILTQIQDEAVILL
ncbi:hypothetical protein vseg_009180 [Gypsophila vaccaria]